MTRTEFIDFLERVANYFGAKNMIAEMRINLWYDQCHYVPREALSWIEKKIFEQQDSMPRNLPKLVKALWMGWQDAHPEKMAWETVRCGAPGCENGYIFVRNQEGYGFTAYCDQCAERRRICRAGDPNLSNLADLEAKGLLWRGTPGQERRHA